MRFSIRKPLLFIPKNICLYLVFFISTAIWANVTTGPNPALFPVPDIIKPNVEFWKLVYAKHHSQEVIIHDSEDLDAIYTVVDFHDFYSNPEKVSSRTKWKRIEKIKNTYESELRRIAQKLERRHTLSADETRITNLFKDATPARLRRAAYNVRGQRGMRDRFREGLVRSGLYLQHIREIFSEHGLPQELAYLPHVESSFNFRAYSKFGAAGIWQFTRSTGRMYMKINYDIDERSDPITATEAAARLLKTNYADLNSWPLAITAYNHGRSGMKRAQRRHGSDIGTIVRSYRSRSFGFASRNFYSEFLAAYEVASNYEYYFGHIEFEAPINYVTFKTNKYYTVSAIREKFDLTLEAFKNFNPALRSPVLRGQRRIPKNYLLRLPDRAEIDEHELWASISPAEQFNEQIVSEYYRVRRGDNLSAISSRTRTRIQDLMAYNDLPNAHRIYVGQILKIPQTKEDLAKAREAAEKPAPVEAKPGQVLAAALPKPDIEPTTETKPASKKEEAEESKPEFFQLAEGLATPSSEAAPPNMRADFISRDRLQLVFIPQEEKSVEVQELPELTEFVPEPPSEWITVEPEETLGHFADWLEIAAQELRRINNMSFGQNIHVGQKLHLTYRKVNPEEFQRRRFEYQRSIEEDFFTAFAIDSVAVHQVRRGQSIWSITQNLYNVPLWLVMKYNPGTDLQDLHIGDQIKIPMLADREAATSSANNL